MFYLPIFPDQKKMTPSSPRIKLLVACHKADSAIRNDELYMPIQVGKALHPELNLGFQTDDTGDNISSKNGSYCELTALYWAWKNLRDVDYIGLCHYRRYFDLSHLGDNHLKVTYAYNAAMLDGFDNASAIVQTLAKSDIIVPSVNQFTISVGDAYRQSHVTEDYFTAKRIIQESYPEYAASFERVLDKGNKYSGCNMFITRREIFADYCEWLFSLFEKMEPEIKLSPYPYQQRVFGFLSERLFNVFIHRHNLKVTYCPILMIDENEQGCMSVSPLKSLFLDVKAYLNGCNR